MKQQWWNKTKVKQKEQKWLMIGFKHDSSRFRDSLCDTKWPTLRCHKSINRLIANEIMFLIFVYGINILELILNYIYSI